MPWKVNVSNVTKGHTPKIFCNIKKEKKTSTKSTLSPTKPGYKPQQICIMRNIDHKTLCWERWRPIENKFNWISHNNTAGPFKNSIFPHKMFAWVGKPRLYLNLDWEMVLHHWKLQNTLQLGKKKYLNTVWWLLCFPLQEFCLRNQTHRPACEGCYSKNRRAGQMFSRVLYCPLMSRSVCKFTDQVGSLLMCVCIFSDYTSVCFLFWHLNQTWHLMFMTRILNVHLVAYSEPCLWNVCLMQMN